MDYIQGYGKVESEPKTASGKRTIMLPQFVVEELVKHRADQAEARKKAGDGWEEHGLVFPNIYGRYFDRARLYAIFKKVLEKAMIQGNLS